MPFAPHTPRRPGLGPTRRFGYRGHGPTRSRLVLPAGYSLLFDGSGVGSEDSDGNVVLTSLVDRVQGLSFTPGALSTQRPKRIPSDLQLGGRPSILYGNAQSSSPAQFFADATAANPIWKPMWTYELGTGATMMLVCRLAGDGSNVQPFGNVATGSVASRGAGFGWLIQPGLTGHVDAYSWKLNQTLSAASSAAGTFLNGRTNVLTHVSRPTGGTGGRGSYEDRLNGVVFATTGSGSTIAAAADQAPSDPMTFGAWSATDGATGGFGGRIPLLVYWPRALSTAELEQAETNLPAWYANAPLGANTGALAGVTPLSQASVFVTGTSIDFGYNDEAENGYAGYAKTTIEPGWSDLDLEFVGSNTGTVINVGAFSGGTIRGEGSALGLDTVASDHPLRVDHQIATLAGAGKLARIVVSMPIGWVNDLGIAIATSLQRDHLGDQKRLMLRIVSLIRGYVPTADIRFVLMTCTPENTTIGGFLETEIYAHNDGARNLADAVASETGCPVVIVDAFSVINANLAAYLDDGLHLTQLGARTLSPYFANGVRYVCGLS